MTEGDPTDRLSAKHQFVLVLRLVIEVDGKVTGELMDPLLRRRQRFIGLASLVDALREWIDDALSSTVDQMRHHATRHAGSTNAVDNDNAAPDPTGGGGSTRGHRGTA